MNRFITADEYARAWHEAFKRNLRKAISDDIDQQIAGFGDPPSGIFGVYLNGCPVLTEGPQKDDL